MPAKRNNLHFRPQDINSSLAAWLEIAPGLLDCHERAYEKPHLVCPLPGLTFRALELLPPEDVRVVILGQDPYSTPGKASGIAFGYHPAYEGRIDSSMENILRELGIYDEVMQLPQAERRQFLTLEHWVRQGVLLLNTRLSVPIGTPMGHSNIGWDEPIRKLLRAVQLLNPDTVFLLWGSEAHKYAPAPKDSPAILTSHPCRHSHSRTATPFSGSSCFERVNSLIDGEIVDWYGPHLSGGEK